MRLVDYEDVWVFVDDALCEGNGCLVPDHPVVKRVAAADVGGLGTEGDTTLVHDFARLHASPKMIARQRGQTDLQERQGVGPGLRHPRREQSRRR